MHLPTEQQVPDPETSIKKQRTNRVSLENLCALFACPSVSTKSCCCLIPPCLSTNSADYIIFQECWRKMAKISSIYEGNPFSFPRQPGEGGLSEARGPGGQWWIGAKSENGSKGEKCKETNPKFSL